MYSPHKCHLENAADQRRNRCLLSSFIGFGIERHRVRETEQRLWDELSAAEQELEISKAVREYREWWHTLSLSQRWAERRRAELKVARSYRAAFREVRIGRSMRPQALAKASLEVAHRTGDGLGARTGLKQSNFQMEA